MIHFLSVIFPRGCSKNLFTIKFISPLESPQPNHFPTSFFLKTPSAPSLSHFEEGCRFEFFSKTSSARTPLEPPISLYHEIFFFGGGHQPGLSTPLFSVVIHHDFSYAVFICILSVSENKPAQITSRFPDD
jgi:hypothetical protein